MTFGKCKVCGTQQIIWDLDSEGKCKDNCFDGYSRHLNIQLIAPTATNEQKTEVMGTMLELCKALGTAEQAAAHMRKHPEDLFAPVDKALHAKSTADRTYYPGGVPETLSMLDAALGVAQEKVGAFVMGLAEMAATRGFTQPEDGSENRYDERRDRQSPGRHLFWWLVHNNIAHPLIGLVPRRFAFDFHDWTSRKLHGR